MMLSRLAVRAVALSARPTTSSAIVAPVGLLAARWQQQRSFAAKPEGRKKTSDPTIRFLVFLVGKGIFVVVSCVCIVLRAFCGKGYYLRGRSCLRLLQRSSDRRHRHLITRASSDKLHLARQDAAAEAEEDGHCRYVGRGSNNLKKEKKLMYEIQAAGLSVSE